MVRRILWHLDRHPIARFPPGRTGAVAGRVLEPTAQPALRGPLTGQACAAYQLLVWSMSITGPIAYPPIVFENRCVPFAIDDGSGRARVDPRSAELALAYRRIASGTPGVDLPLDLVPVLVRSGFTEPWGRFGFEERNLLPGDWVVVCGTGDVEPDPDTVGDAGYRQGAAGRLVVAAAGGFPLAISNDEGLRAQPRRTVRLV